MWELATSLSPCPLPILNSQFPTPEHLCRCQLITTGRSRLELLPVLLLEIGYGHHPHSGCWR
jgi:hypothetical protein